MKTIALAGPLATAALAAACASPPHPPAAAATPITTAVDRARMTDIPATFEAGGIVRARTTAVLAARVMAPVTAVHAQPGDRVRHGDRLVTLDARELEANRTRAAAALAAAVESARAAESDVSSADAALTLARATNERVAGLFEKRSATAQERDQAAAAASGAEAQVAGARARAAAAGAAREAAASAKEAAEVAASYAVVTAPFDGLVIARAVDPGSMAAPGMALLTLEDPSAYRLEVNVDEARAARVAVGDTPDVSLDQVSGGAWRAGRVAEVARLDPASHSFVVKIDLPAGAPIRSGVFGRARFDGPVRRALTVPESAVVRRGELAFVFAVDGQNARLQPVSVGASAGGRIEVLAGLRDGEQVVTRPSPALADGDPVAGARP